MDVNVQKEKVLLSIPADFMMFLSEYSRLRVACQLYTAKNVLT